MEIEAKQMNEVDFKHDLEYYHAARVLDELGIEKKDCIFSDRPDIIVQDYAGKTIGIEVTSYGKNGRMLSSACQKILTEYARMVDRESEKRYQICVMFHGAELNESLNYFQIKKQIFDEINGLRSGKLKEYQCKYVSHVSFYDLEKADKSFAGLTTAYIYDDVDMDVLNSIINDKTVKLDSYKGINSNAQLSEYWLIINFPTEEHTDLRTVGEIPGLDNNPYQRIYLSDPLYCKRIK